jgi:hypothetical protein
MTVRITTAIKILAVNFNDKKSIFDMLYYNNVIIYYLIRVLQRFYVEKVLKVLLKVRNKLTCRPQSCRYVDAVVNKRHSTNERA